MKKSLQIAFEEAKQFSILHPDIKVRVMDKKYKKAVVSTSDWTYRERVLEGWYTVAIFQNGKEI